jgi:hypothetical protein
MPLLLQSSSVQMGLFPQPGSMEVSPAPGAMAVRLLLQPGPVKVSRLVLPFLVRGAGN